MSAASPTATGSAPYGHRLHPRQDFSDLVGCVLRCRGFCQLSGQNRKILRFVIVPDLQDIVLLPRKLTEPMPSPGGSWRRPSPTTMLMTDRRSVLCWTRSKNPLPSIVTLQRFAT